MEDGRKVALQSFTRVHLVPRVNGAAAAALVFERRDQEPLAMSLPLEVMVQVFGVLPQVIAQSSAEAGAAATPLDVPTPWVLDQLELQRDGEQARLLVQIQEAQGSQVGGQPPFRRRTFSAIRWLAGPACVLQ